MINGFTGVSLLFILEILKSKKSQFRHSTPFKHFTL